MFEKGSQVFLYLLTVASWAHPFTDVGATIDYTSILVVLMTRLFIDLLAQQKEVIL
jgi:hypothetical protein